MTTETRAPEGDVNEAAEAESGPVETAEAPQGETAARTGRGTGKAYEKDPEKFWYEQGYAAGKKGKTFDAGAAEDHPRYVKGYAKHQEVPEDFRHLLNKPVKGEAPAD